MSQNLPPLNKKQELNKILQKMAEVLDISTAQYKDAVDKYHVIAEYLGEDKAIKDLDPDLYPQGSFALGTVVKPPEEEEFDIDLVCELKGASVKNLTQEELKDLIGDRLKAGRYRAMLKDLTGGNRCWTIEYADSTESERTTRLHVDVLPALPDQATRIFFERSGNDYAKTAISITDKPRPNFKKISDDWVKSNPKGYQQWFKQRMITQLNERKRLFAESTKAKVDDVPDWQVKTPLQVAIQLLKKHRDENCECNDDRPISIIITTLAALAYSNEDNLYDALLGALNRMESHITYSYQGMRKVAAVMNPVDNRENFADKWITYPEREKAFLKWLGEAKTFFNRLLENGTTVQTLSESLTKGFGDSAVKKTFSALGEDMKNLRVADALQMGIGTGLLGPNFPKEISKNVPDHNFHGNGR